MTNFDFIPNNSERTEPDMAIVTLFLKAFFDRKEFMSVARLQGHHDRLTAQGKIKEFKHFDPEPMVDLKEVDYMYAFEVLKSKGYHIEKHIGVHGYPIEYRLRTTKDPRRLYI